MDTLASIGFEADVRALKQADDALKQLEQTSSKVEQTTKRQDQAADRLVSTMLEQAKTIGMSNRELLLYKATQLGATDADKKALNAAVDKIEAYERMTASARAAAAATDNATGAMGGMRGVAGQLGYQIQDIAVQLQMGTNALMVFGQQGSQIAAAFGPTGAVVGAFLAVGAALGTAFLPALFDSKKAADDLSESIEYLAGIAEVDGSTGIASLTSELTRLMQVSKVSADLQLATGIAAAEKAAKDAASAISTAANSITDSFGPLGVNLDDAVAKFDSMNARAKDFGRISASELESASETYSGIGDAFGFAGGKAEAFGVSLVAALSEMKRTNDVAGFESELSKLLSSFGAGNGKLSEFTISVTEFFKQARTAAETLEFLRKAQNDFNGAISESRVKDLSQELALVNAEMSGGEASAAKLAEAFRLGFDSVEKLPPEIAALVDKLIAAKEALKGIENQVKRIADAEKELDEILNNNIEGPEALLEIYENRAKAAEKLMDEWSETVDYQDKETKRLVSISEKAAERIESAFADAWMNAFDGFSSVVDGMKNAFKRMLAEMAHMALTRPIMVSMGLGGMLPGAASAASGGVAGGLSTAASGLGLLGGIGSSITGLGGMLGGAFGGGLAGAGGLISAGNFGAMFSGAGSLFGSGNIAAGLGMAAPLIAAAVVGALGLNKLTGGGLFGTSYKTTGQSLGLSLSGGDVSGSITTEESRKRSLFRGTKRRTSTSAFDTSAVDDAFDSILAAVGDAATAFGIEGADAIIKNFNASVAIDIKGKSQAEIEQAIQEWIGSTTSGIVSAVFGDSLAEFQYEGEGVIDTVNRLTLNMNSVKTMADNLGLGFDLTGRAAMAAATNIVELAGGLDNLNALTSQYYSVFYSEAERQLNLQNKLSEAFAELNISMPATREGFRAIVDSLDLTTEEGQKLFAALMQLVPGLAQYYDALEQQAGGLDALKDAANAAYVALERSISAEKDRANAILETARIAHATEINRLDALRDAANKENDRLKGNLSSAEDMLKKSFDAEKDKIRTAADIRIEGLNAEIAAAQDAASSRIDGLNAEKSALQSMASDLRGLADSLVSAVGGAVNTDVMASLSAARRGNFEPAKTLSVPEIVASSFGSASDMGFAAAVQKARVMEIAGLADKEATIAERQMMAIENQIAAVRSGADSTVNAIKEQIDAINAQTDQQINDLDKQLNALLGVDTSVLSLDESIKAYQQAQLELDQFGYDEQIAELDRLAAIADAQLAESVAANAIEIARLDSLLDAARLELDAALGIDNSIKSVAQAIADLRAAILLINSPPVTPPPPPPAPAPTPAPVSGGNLDVEEVKSAIEASARANAETANLLRSIYRGEITVRVAN